MKRGYKTRRVYQVRCHSRLLGWRTRLRNNYNGLQDWCDHSDLWGLSMRLGFPSAHAAWDANPVIEGSTNPIDFRLVTL